MKSLITIILTLFICTVTLAQTDEEKAQANNPLASITAFNLQQYYSSNLSGDSQATSGTYWLRFATPTGRVLWRASLPFGTYSSEKTGLDESGMGDLDVFAAYLAIQKPKFTFGIGPSFSAPTATSDYLGTGKWTAGAAAVVFANVSPKFQTGALAIWRTDFAGDQQREDVDIFAFQPFAFFQINNGFYFRSAPTWNFNLNNGDYNVPLGFGVGKVLKINKTVLNFFVEPQYSVLHQGNNQPLFQVYSALNMQF